MTLNSAYCAFEHSSCFYDMVSKAYSPFALSVDASFYPNILHRPIRSLMLKLIRFRLSTRTRSLRVRQSSFVFHCLLVYRFGFTFVFGTSTCLAVLSTIWPDQISVRRLGKLASYFLHP